MNVSLPPQLKRFVEKKVKDGEYQAESDVVCDALRGLRERDHLLRGNASRLVSASSSPYDRAISNMGVGDGDIEATAFIVLMQAANDTEKDLRMIMAEVKAMTAAKQKLRELIAKVNKDVAANAGQTDGRSPLNFQTGMGSQKAYHQAQMPFVDLESEGGVKLISTDLFRGEIGDVSQVVAIRENLTGKLDSMNDMSEMTSMRLQMMMDRRSKFFSTLSNIMKKISTTQDTLVQNLK
jgi:putative addiction module CopG family antidote